MKKTFIIPSIITNSNNESIFSSEEHPLHARGAMLLSEQIGALNLRLRTSEAGYHSDWHVAGDPTLIVVQQGILRIILRDHSYRDFAAGDAFVAKDRLQDDKTVFDPTLHGHRAEVIGDEDLLAIHIKLSSTFDV